MKTRLAILLSALAISLADVSAFAQESFPMVCRGGGSMRADILANGTMRVFFVPAAQGANTAPPESGQCTFLDRALRPGEPHVLLTTFGAGRVLVDTMVTGGAFDVHVFNNNQGAMQVTRVGPWPVENSFTHRQFPTPTPSAWAAKVDHDLATEMTKVMRKAGLSVGEEDATRLPSLSA